MRFVKLARTFGVTALVIGAALAVLSPTHGSPTVQQDAKASLAVSEPSQAQHHITRIVLGEAGFATRAKPDGTLECLPATQTIKLAPTAITTGAGGTIQVKYPTKKPVLAVMVNLERTIDTNLTGPGARYGNGTSDTPDIEFSKKFVDGEVRRVDICTPFF